MKNKIIALLFALAAAFTFQYSTTYAADVNNLDVAEPTNIYTFMDEIEVLSPKARAVSTIAEEDFRTWTQDDERWGTIELGKSGNTMKKSGCLVTSVTKIAIQAGLKDKGSFTPATLVTWLNQNGGFTDGGGLYWAKPAEMISGLSHYGRLLEDNIGAYKSSEYDKQFIEWIKNGYHLVVRVKSGGHWVAIDEAKTLETGKTHIMDSLPANVNADLTLAERYEVFDRVEAYKGGKTPSGSIGDSGSDDVTKPDDSEHVHDYNRMVYSKATKDKTGKLKDTCKICGYEKFVTISRINTVKTQYKSYYYTGKARKPKVIVTNKMGNEINSKYYTLTYSSGRKNIGEYTVTVDFKERYEGRVILVFKVIPKKTSILKLTEKDNAFKVKWEKVEEAGWYEICYSTTSDFSKNTGTKRVSNKYTSSTVRDLKSDTTYYVKMRTYKKVDGVRYYSGWTQVEDITTN